LIEIANPLGWWATHFIQFLHVSYLVHQIFNIVGSHIEIERIFNIDGVVTHLQWFGFKLTTWIYSWSLLKIDVMMLVLGVQEPTKTH
jgi:hypothetical protein